MGDVAVIFKVLSVDQEKGELVYTYRIPHPNGKTEIGGRAKIGQDIEVRHAELKGDA